MSALVRVENSSSGLSIAFVCAILWEAVLKTGRQQGDMQSQAADDTVLRRGSKVAGQAKVGDSGEPEPRFDAQEIGPGRQCARLSWTVQFWPDKTCRSSAFVGFGRHHAAESVIFLPLLSSVHAVKLPEAHPAPSQL